MQSTLLWNAELRWHQVDKEGNISCMKSSLAFCLDYLGFFSPSFQASIYLCLWPHSPAMRQFGRLFIFWAFILARPAGCDRAELFPQHLDARCQNPDEPSLFAPVTYSSFFFILHMHSFPLSSTTLYVSSLLLSCYSRWTVQISFYLQAEWGPAIKQRTNTGSAAHQYTRVGSIT